MNERIYQGSDEQWYFRARGNTSVGPFASPAQADKALQRQIKGWSGRALPRAIWPKNLDTARIFNRSATRHS